MANSRKCANATCTCLAPDKKKYCSDHCQGMGNKIEIMCLCGHSGCDISVDQPSAPFDALAHPEAGPPAVRL